ncbi:MAG: Ig-like domain repeat protein [Burkholderiales bacterium]|nr:Ig-like domain repeat protein [Burkholderiales bacterium]
MRPWHRSRHTRCAPLILLQWARVALFMVSLGLCHAAWSQSLDLAHPVKRIVDQIDPRVRLPLPSTKDNRPASHQDLGPLSDDERIDHVILTLRPTSDQAQALEQLTRDQHDPRSPHYRHWLSPREFASTFGADPDDVAAVSQWLKDQGFQVEDRSTSRRAIVFSGTALQINQAFGTRIHRFQSPRGVYQATAQTPSIPQALSPVIEGLVSLSGPPSRPLHTRQAPSPNYTMGSSHYLSPADFRTIYNLTTLSNQSINGQGQSIAILGRSDIALSDIQKFRSSMGLSNRDPQIIVNGSDPGFVSGDEGESDLDVEWAGAVAPNATIQFITSASTASTDGITLSAQYAVNHDVADIISVSYGQCEKQMGTSALNYYHSLWQQAASQGITVVVSSGDSGAADCDAPSASTATHGAGVNGLCSSPYATCVGGTRFADASNPSLYWSSSNDSQGGSALSYIPEVVWNDSGNNGGSGLWASGGGASIKFSKPSWQTTAGVPADGKRDVPDLSLNASTHDGYLGYSSDNSTRTQTLLVFGGTSAAAPSLAGILALINQSTGYRQGLINPTLYGLASAQAGGGRSYFHTVTSGNNSVPGQSGFSASTSTPAYNQATGLGSVNGDVFVRHWTDLLPTTSTALSLDVTSSIFGQTVTLSATVSGQGPSGSVQFMDNGVAIGAAVPLSNGTASYATSSLAVGPHNLTATYGGDPANQASTSASVALSVQQTSSVTLQATPSSLQAGQAVTLTAQVSGSSPTGSVQFKDGANDLGAPVAVSSGMATLSINLMTAGDHSLSGVYLGDSNNTSSQSAATSLTVSPAHTTTTLTSSANPAATDAQVTLTATVEGAAPSGSVEFRDGTTSLGTATLSGNSAALVVTGLAPGDHTLVAVYAGDANNQSSQSSALTQSITSVASQADVPTLPGWGIVLLAALLAMAGRIQATHQGKDPLA